MAKVVGIGFKDVGKIYWFNPGNIDIKPGYMVVVETIRGLELGKVLEGIKEIDDSLLEHELKNVIRVATEKDLKNSLDNYAKANEAILRAKNIISEHQLDMKTVGCEYTLDGSKMMIYYTAEGRVDFRELVKDLASEFKVRIELRQIGQREGAKMLGAIGACGREVCCKTHIREFDLVTMKMAKDQGMALSANKVAGVCGKLMCCISYENDYYVEVKKRVPSVGDMVKTPSGGCCKVISVDYLRELVKTFNHENDEFELWKANEIKKMKPEKSGERHTNGSDA